MPPSSAALSNGVAAGPNKGHKVTKLPRKPNKHKKKVIYLSYFKVSSKINQDHWLRELLEKSLV